MRFIGGFIGLPLMPCKNRVSLTRRRENGMTRAARVKREALTAIRRRFTVAELAAHGRDSTPRNTLASTPFQAILKELGKHLKIRFACARCASLQTPRNSKELI
jgi:hypothetical protein